MDVNDWRPESKEPNTEIGQIFWYLCTHPSFWIYYVAQAAEDDSHNFTVCLIET